MTRSRSMHPARRLTLESLDQKVLPSGGPVTPAGVTLNSFGVLNIKGESADDVATVTIENGQVRAVLQHKKYVIDLGSQTTLTILDADKFFPLAQVKSIAFQGQGGNDSFTNDTALKCSAFGSDGNDVLVGGPAGDLIIGGDGTDTLEGRRGNDDLRGGTGDDTYVFGPLPLLGRGGLGSDRVTEAANLDADHLDLSALGGGVAVNLGLTATQTVKVGYLSLTLSSPVGVENVTGTPGADKLLGNARPNRISGLAGNDSVQGYGGPDVLWGGTGADDMHGGTENDMVFGGDDPDRLFGDAGNDTIEGGAGGDQIEGWTGNDRLWGEGGDDGVIGGLGDDLLGGGAGADALDGGGNNDRVWGGTENDAVLGGAGADDLFGDAGDDLVNGGTGKDTQDGGAGGFDTLLADQGNETLSNGEVVRITVPGGSPQTDGWSCGPNSASRLLRSYGLTSATYAALKSDAQQATVISKYGLGTPPPALRDIMRKYKEDTQLASGADFQSVLDRLGEGRPVVALLGWGEVDVPVPPESPWDFDLFDTAPETLHYVCLTGFDSAAGTIFYTDTSGTAKSMSYAAFQKKWNWPGDGLPLEVLEALGVKKRTMLW